jgi:signal peptidase I
MDPAIRGDGHASAPVGWDRATEQRNDWPMMLVVAGTVAVAFFVLSAAIVLRERLVVVDVEGSSMQPTLRDRDRVLVRRCGVDRVRRGQVVVVSPPWRLADDVRWLIKRAVAVPGDPVPRTEVAALAAAAETRVPAGKLVVLGDNSAASFDSRTAGYFDADALLGVVVRPMRDRSGIERPDMPDATDSVR